MSLTKSWSGGFMEFWQNVQNIFAVQLENPESINLNEFQGSFESNPISQIVDSFSDLSETTGANVNKLIDNASENWNTFLNDISDNMENFGFNFDNIKYIVIAIAVIAVVALSIYLFSSIRPLVKTGSKTISKAIEK